MRHFSHNLGNRELRIEDLKKGDFVLVTRRCNPEEWDGWVASMDRAIGGVYEVVDTYDKERWRGLAIGVARLRDGIGSWWYPLLVLEKYIMQSTTRKKYIGGGDETF